MFNACLYQNQELAEIFSYNTKSLLRNLRWSIDRQVIEFQYNPIFPPIIAICADAALCHIILDNIA